MAGGRGRWSYCTHSQETEGNECSHERGSPFCIDSSQWYGAINIFDVPSKLI